jgi:CheY-like chemotaxis protein
MATFLVVDDHPTNREFLVTLLGYRGHHLLQAADGAEALEVARAEHPDLIISDILMPTMDGYEFVRQLRADPDLGHLPVIFSTAHYLDQEASALAHQCGVPFILPKPSDPETVLGMVNAALGLTSAMIRPPCINYSRTTWTIE